MTAAGASGGPAGAGGAAVASAGAAAGIGGSSGSSAGTSGSPSAGVGGTGDACPNNPRKSAPGPCGCDTTADQETACQALIAGLAHRYSFSGAGTTVKDSKGTSDAAAINLSLSNTGNLDFTIGDQYADLPNIAKLKTTLDVYGNPLLDNTIVPYVTEVARATHDRSPIPVVLLGGKNLGIKHGKFLKLARNRPHNDLWISIAQALGVPLDQLQGQRGPAFDPSTYTGAVSELFA